MIMSIRVGTNDVSKARAFYDATFTALGGAPTALPASAPMGMYQLPGGRVFLVGPAADGAPASYADGGTILLVAKDEAAVDAWHAAGLANHGSDEGAPGHRERPNRHGAYLRDPDGNKLGCYVGNLFG